MSETNTPADKEGMTAGDTTSEAADEQRSDEELLAELELLREENRRLRESYIRAKRSQYRNVAVGLGILGALATVGAALFPPVRTVLLALGATGLFGGLLTYYLTPERFLTADVGEAVYAALAANGEAIVSELGLEDEHIYVPTGQTGARVKLFVPQQPTYKIPDETVLESVFVVTDDSEERGIALDPSGAGLFAEFERALDGPLAEMMPDLTAQLRDGLVEQFEIAESAEFDADKSGRVTAEIRGSVYGDLDQFDHPVRSFVAIALAQGLDRPVWIDRADTHTVTFRLSEPGEK